MMRWRGAVALLLINGPLAAQAQKIALWPVVIERDLGPMPRAHAIFDSLIAQRVQAMGFEVVPTTEQQTIWNRLRDSIGGFYDTYTGRVIPEKLQVVIAGTRRELATRFGAAAILQSSVVSVNIPFGGGEAHWHGTSQKSGGRGGLAGVLFGRSVGRVVALSLVVFVHDSAGKPLYDGVGGIELLGHFQGGVHRVPAESLFTDSLRTRAAVGLALASLPRVLRAAAPLNEYRDSTP